MAWGAPKPAAALVDASLQPRDLFDRYGTVLALQVVEIDEAGEAVVLEVTDRPKGAFEPERVRLTVDGDDPLEAFYSVIMPDQPMVAYLNAARRRDRGKVLFYAAEGHDFFPARPFTRFAEERIIGELPSPARGLALYDINGDGELEVVAVAPLPKS